MKSPKAILFLTIFIDLFGFSIVIPILPNYVKDLSDSNLMVGFTAAIFSIMQFIFTPVWGAMSDRFGRRPIILASLIGSSIAYFVFSFAATLPILLIARAMSGIGSGNISAAQAYISDITPPEKRAKSMGLIGAAFGMGFIFGPPVGGFLMAGFGFYSIGLFCMALCIINLVFAYFFLPESLQVKKTDTKIKFPINDMAILLTKPVMIRLFIINFLYISAFFFFQINSPILWKNKYLLDEKHIGIVFSFIGVCTTIVQGALIGVFHRFFGEKAMILFGNLLLGVSIALIPFVPVEYFWYLELPLLGLMAVSNGFIGPSNLAMVSKATDAAHQGVTMGLFQSIGSLARVFGPLLGSVLYGLHFKIPYLAACFLLFINALIVIGMIKSNKKSE